MHIYSFEKLEVWKGARNSALSIYNLTGKFPIEEKFGVVSQMRRSSTSIASSLAEGSSRASAKEKSYFYSVAYSSNSKPSTK